MFQFSGFASCITGLHSRLCRVAPFGNLRMNGYLHLPAAYRSLSRPSSPLRAKASSVRPFLLSYCIAISRIYQTNPINPFNRNPSVFLNLFVSSSMSMNFALLKACSTEGNRTLHFHSHQACLSLVFVVPPRVELGTSTLSV
jgi:hypothetical protein